MAQMDTSDSGGKHKKGGVRSKKMSTRVDMTPMVDLAFLLVTFFMLTTTFNKPTVMDIKMPAKVKDIKDLQDVPESKTMSVILGGGDTIWYYMGLKPDLIQSSYAADGIRKILLDKRQQVMNNNQGKNDAIVLIKATARSNFKNVVDMFDEMSITKIGTYALVDLTDDEKKLVAEKQAGSPSTPPAGN